MFDNDKYSVTQIFQRIIDELNDLINEDSLTKEIVTDLKDKGL